MKSKRKPPESHRMPSPIGTSLPVQPMNYPQHTIPTPDLGNGIGMPMSPGRELVPGSEIYG